MKPKKIYLQCGEEHNCKTKDCLNCPRSDDSKLQLTLAEEIIIEDFGTCDLKKMIKEKPETIELMQTISRKLMHKIFNLDTK